MSVSVADILRMPGLALSLVAGRSATGHPIRWVHVSELEDPTPWLKGGELLMTTGMGVPKTAARQRAYVRRLSEAGLAGLGFGLGFSYSRVPAALIRAADELGFPVFEVPYQVPFIAITEAVFTRLVAEQYDVLHRAVEGQHALTRAVLEGEGVEGIAASLARVVSGWALLLDLHGMALASTGRAARSRAGRLWAEVQASRPEGTGFSLTLVDQGHHVWIQPVGAHGRVEAFLAVGKPRALTQLDRIVSGHALSLFAIELAKSRAVAEAERRLQGDFFDSLIGGSLSPAEALRGLSRFGFSREGPVRVVSIEGEPADELAWAAEDVLSRRDRAYLISPHEGGVHVLVPDSPADGDADQARSLRAELEARLATSLRSGTGGAVPPVEAGRSLREARYALRVCRLEGWDDAGFDDLGTYRLLLSMTEPDALRAFADSLLAPLDGYDSEGGGELLPSLRAFLQHNARWESAAAELFVHRHTLRYRMRKVEELTGRDLGSSFDRMEFWLALRARELLAAGAGE
ncbi:MAG: PucR family transcriptional regulator ligand-binding domain-containing protein [Actinobacteria bacterium]|nr:PucR family transcriptional regulator ligand-binding domain-containing protein [Actinomycetota bacterium]